MSFLVDDLLGAVLDEIWSDVGTISPPATWYIALFEVAPDTDGTGGTEASYTDYARVAVTNDATEWVAASGSPPVKTNTNPVEFGVAGSGPTDVVGFGF
jgi:hypothetical protein